MNWDTLGRSADKAKNGDSASVTGDTIVKPCPSFGLLL